VKEIKNEVKGILKNVTTIYQNSTRILKDVEE
jgi:hypothetical protein